MPDETKIARIKECVNRLVKEGLLGNLAKFTLVLATPRIVPENVIEAANKEGIRVIDGNGLSTLVDCIQTGNVQGIRQFWGIRFCVRTTRPTHTFNYKRRHFTFQPRRRLSRMIIVQYCIKCDADTNLVLI